MKRVPRWSYWVGGLLIVALYVWVFYYYFVSSYGPRWRTMYGDLTHPEGYEVHGIDISHHQGVIDFEKMRSQGLIDGCPVRFIMMKATEGTDRVDKRFSYNFRQAHEYGFTRGVYHFYSVHSSAKAQANFFLRNVKLQRGDLPPVLDVEHKPDDQSVDLFQASVLQWLHIVEHHFGVKPIIYTYYKFKLSYLSDPVFDDYPYWIAHYTQDSLAYQGPWKFWQYTDKGQLPGIKGSVDFNVYNGSYYDLRQLTIGSKEPIGVDAYRDDD